MADIAMCFSETCPVRDTCYRHTAPRNPDWQDFADFDSYCHGNYPCDEYIPNKKEEKVNANR